MNEKQISEIVASVIKSMETTGSKTSQKGVFTNMTDALNAVQKAYKELKNYTVAQREEMIKNIRRLTMEEAETMAKLGVEETGMGRVADKIIKHQLVAKKTPGTEDLHPTAITGDDGMTLIEMAPYGVIGSITPSTNPSETVLCNSMGMIAGGNGVVFNPHPHAAKTANYAVDLVNRAVLEAGGPENIVVSVEKPTKESSDEMMHSPIVRMLVATGGPGVVKALLSSGKKAIGAGAGNPPVIVDDTADIKKAAEDIVNGASFDNNLPCIAEKEVIVVDAVADMLIHNMKKNGAYLVKNQQTIDNLVNLVVKDGKPVTEFVGKSAKYIFSKIGVEVDDSVRTIMIEATEDHPFVQVELMMPILPVVRVDNVDDAIEMAVRVEHGNRHSAMMHSKNVDKLSKMAKLIQTTIFVKNGPSYAGLGAGGMGIATFTIAGPTGEGLTSAKSFCRKRKCVLVGGLDVR